MKQVITLATFYLITVLCFVGSCKKENQNKHLGLKSKTVKASVIEYGSGKVIAGATLSVCTTVYLNQDIYECAGDYLNFKTDVNGHCFFDTDSVYRFKDLISVLKDGYFDLDEPNTGCLFEDDSPNAYGHTNTADSFTVIKVPMTYVIVHLKSTFRYDFPVMFTETGLISSRIPGSQNSECRFSGGHIFNLRPGIDTTFQYHVFGNAENEFIISRDYDTDIGAPIDEIMRTIRYIPKAGIDTVEINF